MQEHFFDEFGSVFVGRLSGDKQRRLSRVMTRAPHSAVVLLGAARL